VGGCKRGRGQGCGAQPVPPKGAQRLQQRPGPLQLRGLAAMVQPARGAAAVAPGGGADVPAGRQASLGARQGHCAVAASGARATPQASRFDQHRYWEQFFFA